jgi:superfamily II DNA or RNA helicase
VTPWLGNTPRRWQPEALEAARGAFRSGLRRVVVQAATGAGKSVWLAEVCATAKGRVLVTTPTQALTEQLAETLSARSPGEVGRCYQRAWEPDARVVVTCAASVPTLLAERPSWDLWVSDEAHRRVTVPEARHAVALTATPFRGMAEWGPKAGGLDRPAYVYSAAQATEDGVLVPFRVERYAGQHDHLPEDQRTDAAVRGWVSAASGAGIITAQTVAEAEAFAASCPGVGVVSGYDAPGTLAVAKARLQAGELRALVSVRLLGEGIDWPWLEWACLRVPVASPTRLVQFVGRVLRAAPGKHGATFYDPHGSLDAVGLTHPAALDDVASGATEEEVEMWEIPELLGLGEAWAALPAPVAVAAWEGWAADLRFRLASAWGMDRPAGDRTAAATPGQRRRLAALSGRAVGRLPEWCRVGVRWLVEHPTLSKGAAQDAIDALGAIAKAHAAHQQRTGRWTWVVPKGLVPDAPLAARRAA